MPGSRKLRTVTALVALAVGSLTVVAGTAGPAGAVVVTNEGQFRSAFDNPTIDSIDLIGDIDLTCGGGVVPTAVRTSTTALTVDGNGHTLRQTCGDQPTLAQIGTGSMTFVGITFTGGAAGIVSDGHVTLESSTITGLESPTLAGAVGVVGFGVTVRNSTISDIQSDVGGVFAVASDNGVVVESSQITDLRSSSSGAGGIFALDGNTTITASSITEIHGRVAALGIFAPLVGDDLDMTGSTLRAVVAQDATIGVLAGGSLHMTDSAVLDTVSPGGVIGVAATESADLVRSTIAHTRGLAIGALSSTGPSSLTNSTIADNDAGINVVNLTNPTTASLSLVYSDIVRNGEGASTLGTLSTAQVQPGDLIPPIARKYVDASSVPPISLSGGVSAQQLVAQVVALGPFESFGSVVSNPQDADNCLVLGGTVSHGFNYSDDDTCELANPFDQEDAPDPLLGALGYNGGGTPTLLRGPGSRLLDAIPASACQSDGAAGVTTDQRGVTRPQLGRCDIGAVEVANVLAPIAVNPTFTG